MNPDEEIQLPINNTQQLPEAAVVADAERKKLPKWAAILIAVGGGLVVLGAILGAILLVQLGSSLARPVAVSNQFIDAIQANDASAAYALGSGAFKNAVTEASLAGTIERISSTFSGDEVIINQKVKTMNGTNTAEIEYAVENGGSTYYMLISLQENNGQWQVQAFKSGGARFTTENK